MDGLMRLQVWRPRTDANPPHLMWEQLYRASEGIALCVNGYGRLEVGEHDILPPYRIAVEPVPPDARKAARPAVPTLGQSEPGESLAGGLLDADVPQTVEAKP